MKSKKKFVLAGLALLMTVLLLPLTGCETEVDPSTPQQEQPSENSGSSGGGNAQQPVSGDSNGDNGSDGECICGIQIITLGNITADGGFTDGQVMTIGIKPRGVVASKADFYKYTYQGGEWVSDNPMTVSDFNTIEKVYAYIGISDINHYELQECLNYFQFITDEDNLICDQSDDLLNFDWMVPAEEITLPTAENPVINAHFLHGLAKVTIGNIVYASEYDETPEITDVRFKSFDSSCYNDPYDNIQNEFIGWNINYGIIDVIPFEDKTNGTYTAMLVTNRELNNNDEIIIPTEWTLLTLKVNGEEVEVVIKDDPATEKNEALLEAGTHYTFNLLITANGVHAVCN